MRTRRGSTPSGVSPLHLTFSVAWALTGCAGGTPRDPASTSFSLTSFANDQQVFDYFRGKGLSAVQAAGIAGNLDQESGADPQAVQPGGPGRGIAQWSVGGRWNSDSNDNVSWYAGSQSKDVYSLDLQLDFIWYELTTFAGYGLASLQQATTLTAATVAFQNDFEACGKCNQSQRVAYAKDVLAAFGADTVDGGTSPASDGASAAVTCTVTATGAQGECMEVSACAALGNHTSTPGYCLGSSNTECCTATPSATSPPMPAPNGVMDGTPGHATGNILDRADSPSTGTPVSRSSGCSAAAGAGDAPFGALLVLLGVLLLRVRGAAAPLRSPGRAQGVTSNR
jgi:hypothetical protein